MSSEEIVQAGIAKLKAAGLIDHRTVDSSGVLYPKLPGLGGAGEGISYLRNREALGRYFIRSRAIGNHFLADTSLDLFGRNLKTPIIGAPMSGIDSNLSGQIKEADFLTAIIGGCKDVGSLGACGDSYDTTSNYLAPSVIGNLGGIAVLKPRNISEISVRIQAIVSAGNVAAIGIDLDGVTGLLLGGGMVSRKNIADLKKIRSQFKGAMFLKGLLSVEDASIAYDLGFDAIVVSNHGGRAIEYSPATAHVLPEIAKKFKGKMKILVDGGVRNGFDVFIYLALGADAVLVGRTFLYAAVGGGRSGVAAVISRMTSDLSRAMLLTGCRNLAQISAQSIERYV